MFDFIRLMPDLGMLLTMIVFGILCIVAVFLAIVLIDRLKKRYKMSILYKCSKLQKENAKLRKYIKKMMMENIHG